MKTAVVIGGGITGLTTMYYLQKYILEHTIDLKLILIEQNERLGGKIKTVSDGEFVMETGADSIVARNEGVLPFIKELQLEDEIVYNETGISYIYTNNKLKPIPADTVFGIPTSITSLFTSTLITPKGKIEALKDFVKKNKTYTKNSSVGEFLEAFLGKEIVENQIAPVLSGVYSGSLDKLTMSSTLPYLVDYKNQYGSIIRGMSKNKEKFQSKSQKKFLSFKNGLSHMIDVLEEKLTEADIYKGMKTVRIDKKASQYEITVENGETITTDYLVLTTPHDVTKNLLTDDDLNDEFNKLKNSSLISIYLGFHLPDKELPADGTGFIVTENSDLHCNACTWTSKKWAHTSSKQNLLVRLFYKSTNPVFEDLKKMNEQQLIQTALKDIEKSLHITSKPTSVTVTPWNDLMPTYHLGHQHAVKALNDKLSKSYPHLYLAGASYFGVGIAACIKNGKETAEKIIQSLS
ncbi:protoporphyrinogen oxidase [Bacillus weihaiensis]|uniref:Coproporphyrinogen III oxidase n=1 Tax=Bacillus weihaiensis TaxID=1547283 RepID=A0A1L3MNN4_9BACI|nr:protoporphyrinogen oxidase [Bacillus weihaiensis]APH03951.1 protoporphyrinogen oxidase [Bacillus weihaiensis]